MLYMQAKWINHLRLYYQALLMHQVNKFRHYLPSPMGFEPKRLGLTNVAYQWRI